MIARLVVLTLLLAPRAAWACATCVSSAYGDRTFNWAFLGLILMPFAVATAIAGSFAWWYYAPLRRWAAPYRRARTRLITWGATKWPPKLPTLLRSSRRAKGPAQLAPHEESSL